jgi:hypothetical protein
MLAGLASESMFSSASVARASHIWLLIGELS